MKEIPAKAGIKKGKRPTSHRYDRFTLAAFPPWGIQQELVVWDLPVQIYASFRFCTKFLPSFA